MRKHKDTKKQKEYERYLLSYDMSFDDICKLVDNGIENKLKITYKSICAKAFRGGLYLGAPGKDIYFSFLWLSDEQLGLLAEKLAKQYPSKPPQGHLGYAACIRYIYGCFDKQGCLLSKWHKLMMKEENEDWSMPDKFTNLLNDYFKKNNCEYGQVIYHEMSGHRIGDRLFITRYITQHSK